MKVKTVALSRVSQQSAMSRPDGIKLRKTWKLRAEVILVLGSCLQAKTNC